MKFDGSELRGLEVSLAKAMAGAMKDVTAVVAKGALNIKNEARRLSPKGGHVRQYPNSITYDMRMSVRGPMAEIGPDKEKRQGALGNLLEYGSVNNGPHPHMRPAAQKEQPRFEKALEDVAIKALEA